MNDLISRQAAIEALKREEALTRAFGYHVVIDTIRELPSAQPEIIRCKDCKHRDAEDGFCKGRGWPMQLVPEDGFCDKGERRSEDE